jgi:hypothetical protein
MIRVLAAVPIARITRTRRGRIPILFWFAIALVASIHARSLGQTNGASHILKGPFGYLALPLLTYGIVSAAFGGIGLRPSIRGVVTLGADPRRAAFASVLAAVVFSAIASAVTASIVCIIAHGPTDPPLFKDLIATFGIALFGGAAYAAYFSAGSAIGKGAMRAVFLALDWILGAPGGFGALFTPRGHIMSLLGGSQVFELSRRTSSVFLILLLVGYLALAVRLGRRVR